MTFGEFIRRRRKELKLKQAQFPNFDQTYISRIEQGHNNPTIRETIQQLTETLQFPPNYVNYLWMYSLLDQDPREVLAEIGAPLLSDRGVAEMPVEYYTPKRSLGEITIPMGATPEEVEKLLGRPDKTLLLGKKSKWSYYREEAHIVFEDGRAVDIFFK
jgi:transcriptional regulator with XRE-family HTH domain